MAVSSELSRDMFACQFSSMTYEEAKAIVAKKHHLGNTLVTGHKASYFQEAAELYAQSTDIIKLEKERFAWAIEIFPKATSISSLRKLEEEILEIEADINAGIKEPEEYADALMCLFDSAGRHGIPAEEIIRHFAKKFEKNKKRRWQINPDNTYSHIKLGTEK